MNHKKSNQAEPRIRIIARMRIEPEKLFDIFRDFGGIGKYFPMISRTSVNHDPKLGCLGEGSERVCSLRAGLGSIHEKIVSWNPSEGFSYSASGIMVPMKNHKASISLKSHGDGWTQVEWSHEFETKFGPLGRIFAMMIKQMCKQALVKMSKQLDAVIEF